MNYSPKLFKHILNLYPPYLGAGIRINYISDDWKELHVSMALHWYNRNAVGTHFGGSLYSMIDPHLMLLLMQLLGKEYYIWDKSANIEFVKATKKKVTAIIKISEQELEDIKHKTENGDKFFASFHLKIIDTDNNLIARVKKIIYVRKKSEIKS
jgi:acyl-coenzyme A thioesterase PaaI-like protein